MTGEPLTFDDIAGSRLNYGRARWAAQHGDQTARDLITQVDGAYAALGNSIDHPADNEHGR